MHGLAQSQALTAAAQELSVARASFKAGYPGSETVLAHSKKLYRKALQEYIDPFKVRRDW